MSSEVEVIKDFLTDRGIGIDEIKDYHSGFYITMSIPYANLYKYALAITISGMVYIYIVLGSEIVFEYHLSDPDCFEKLSVALEKLE